MAKTHAASGFVCANCKRTYGDPLYHGPPGHAPQNLCLDCWADEWALIELRMLNGGDWSVLDSALLLVCCGLSRQQAAEVLGLHRNTVHKWLVHLRRNPQDVPDWLLHRAIFSHDYSKGSDHGDPETTDG